MLIQIYNIYSGFFFILSVLSLQIPEEPKKGGPTFAQYRRQYWREHSKRNLPDLYSREKGTVWRQYEELHHRFIPQRSKWAPNWLKNNRINIKRVSSLVHAQKDPYRAKTAPKWAKEEYNLKTK